ncbi:hypothetical protein [Dactylosporangium sp. NPDC005555]|uniref:hypothetical protein n=1 Tax=Dactylosporangium sp. NPDC005555 TaxID=3154889 RepID=UPI0033BA9D2D
MLVDCETCSVRGKACGGCVVTLLLDAPPAVHQLGAAEVRAIEVFERAGFDVTVLDPTHVEAAPRRSRRHRAA